MAIWKRCGEATGIFELAGLLLKVSSHPRHKVPPLHLPGLRNFRCPAWQDYESLPRALRGQRETLQCKGLQASRRGEGGSRWNSSMGIAPCTQYWSCFGLPSPNTVAGLLFFFLISAFVSIRSKSATEQGPRSRTHQERGSSPVFVSVPASRILRLKKAAQRSRWGKVVIGKSSGQIVRGIFKSTRKRAQMDALPV